VSPLARPRLPAALRAGFAGLILAVLALVAGPAPRGAGGVPVGAAASREARGAVAATSGELRGVRGVRGAVGAAASPDGAGLGAADPAAPAAFQPNVGQAGRTVSFVAGDGAGDRVELTRAGTLVASRGRSAAGPSSRLALRLVAANRDPRLAAVGRLAGTVNYLIGPAAAWRTGVPIYGEVVYRSVYPGIDLTYADRGAGLEYTFTLAPRADPRRIAVEVAGARRLRVDPSGDLRVMLAGHTITERPPRIYALVGGVRRIVGGGFRLLGRRRIGFDVGAHDASSPLVIDPTIDFSTRLAGTAPGTGLAVAVDRAGDTYLAGGTSSDDVPTTAHPLEPSRPGTPESAFVAKLDPTGRLVYATYLGGSRYTEARGIAVDASGGAYLTGATNSTDFPTTPGAFQRSYGGGPFDAFVAKLDPTGGRLVYSTFLGDTHYDEGNAIAVDPAGRAVVTGKTVSPEFPVVHPLAPRTTSGAFVTKLDRAGTALVASTVFGGSATGNHGDAGFGIAVDRQGDTYVTGETNDPGFPTVDALQPRLAGGADAFVVKIDATSARIDYATYFGGSGDDVGRAIAADGDGNAYVAGLSTSSDLPTAAAIEAADPSPRPAGSAGFVTKLDPSGNALVFSTYLGGSGDDGASGIAIDRARDVYVTGQTSSPDFPLADPLQRTLHGPQDAFVTELDRTGSSLRFSSYFGGGAADAGLAIAVDRSGAVHFAGSTASTDFPTRGPHRPRPARRPGPGAGAFVGVLRTS
jgi:hypothetical protein